MDTKTNKKEENITLRLITGGKQPPMIGRNWLMEDLEEGAFFSARYTGTGEGPSKWEAFDYHMPAKGERVVTLELIQRDGDQERITRHRVVSDEFSKQWECVEVQYDGGSNRSDQPRGMAVVKDNEGSERDDSLDEKPG